MTLLTFLSLLGGEIEDVCEESFLLFSQKPLSRNLGFIDRASATIDLTVASQDLTIHQSPSLLSSPREAGTTGAVLWKVTPVFADWICSKSNPLFVHGVLSPASFVLELGAGVSAVLALTLGPRIGRYLLSDQEYVLKLAQKNLDENLSTSKSLRSKKPAGGKGAKGTKGNKKSDDAIGGNISAIPLDWETDSISRHPSFQTGMPLSAVIACDCIYNESLVKPFVDTCVDACSLSSPQNPENSTRKDVTMQQQTPTIAIVAQELRSPDVFENWLETFHASFHTYRVPDDILSPELKSAMGFSVHVGILRSTPLSK